MRVLIGCEESQAVTKEFRRLGHEAYSCDLQPCSGGHPEWHLQMDVFTAVENIKPILAIFHPPCTKLSKAGARWMYQGGVINQERLKQGMEAKDFFMRLLSLDIQFIAVENPTPLKIFNLPKPSAYVQPFEFGHPYSKKTLLWLKNLPPLLPTEILYNHIPYLPSNTGGKKRGESYSFGVSRNAKESSKTFPGIAKAMAEQWGKLI